jgi:hypothetical protein
MRDAFVRSAMSDVPKVDYEEQARNLVFECMAKEFHKAFPNIDFDVAKESGWLNQSGLYMPGSLNSVYTYCPNDWRYLEQKQPKLYEKLEKLAALEDSQRTTRRELEQKLHNVALSCSTRKQLAEALPEFEKYLPEDEAKAIRTLPVLTNVVSDFVKAGWPKRERKAA